MRVTSGWHWKHLLRPRPFGQGVCSSEQRRAAAPRASQTQPAVGKVLEDYEPDIDTCVIHSAVSELSIDPDRVSALEDQYRGRFLVGHVGALDTRTKGLEYLIGAARQLESSHPEIVFLVIGGGADEAQPGIASGGYCVPPEGGAGEPRRGPQEPRPALSRLRVQ